MNSSHTAPFRSMDMSRARVPLYSTSEIDLHAIERKKHLSSSNKHEGGKLRFMDQEGASQTPKLLDTTQDKEQGTLALKEDKPKSSTLTNSSSAKCQCRWEITASPPLVPTDIPLDISAMDICGIPLSVIAARVCAFMKLNSICCVYHGQEARADCCTCCGLKFVVQLWLKNTQSASDLDPKAPTPCLETMPIILEVQRRRGCSITMRAVRKRLYWFVMKDNVAGRRVSSLDGYQDLKVSKDPRSSRCIVKDRWEKAKSRCLDWLASQKRDCNRFGMETLLALTNPDRVGRGNSEEIAQALVFGIGNLGNCLRPYFLSILNLSKKPTADGISGNDLDNVSSLECCSSETDDFEQMHLRLLCLQVMSACLDIVNEREQDYLCNDASMLDLTSSFWSQVISNLLWQLENHSTRQHDAALAARCLRIVESLQPNFISRMTKSSIISTVKKAYHCGQQHHSILETESQLLLQCLTLMKD